MPPDPLTRLSKFLSLMLRHQPDQFGLTLDAEGFARVEDVWKQVNRQFPAQYQYPDLLEVCEVRDGKKRFELLEGRIRARYGHSAAKITYPAVTPPELLYHGTSPDALPSIREHGLLPLNRQYVHLSIEAGWARSVGSRHTKKPVVLMIRALDMHNAGHHFHNPDPKHYLTAAVPPEYIVFDEA